jgi:predicted ferric reductase
MTGSAPESARSTCTCAALGVAGIVGAYLSLALAPFALAAITAPQGSGVAAELGSGLALAGYAMLLMQFLLTGRFRTIGGRVGIDVILRLHQIAARMLTVMVLLHPFVYGLPRLFSDPAAYWSSLARMTMMPAFASGVAAWLLLVALMAMALLRPRLAIPYECWRASHGILAVLIALAGLHHALAVGGLSAAPALRWFWIALAALALYTLFHSYVVRPWLQLRDPWRIAEVRALGPARWLVALEPDNRPLAFDAGQFAWLKVGPHPFSLRENPFSIVSAPGARRIEFLIREAGDFTSTVGTLEPGARAWLDGPHGAFTLRAAMDAKRIVLLAGGVGLAPCLSMLRAAASAGDLRQYHLVFGNRCEDQIVPRDALEALAPSLNLKVDYVLSEPPAGWTGAVGQMTPQTLLPLLRSGDVAGTVYYLCGPPPMVTASLRALAALGVPASRIVTERFDYD